MHNWRCCDLAKLIEERFGVSYKERAISNLLKDLGFSFISGRPQHPKQDARVTDAFKKNFPNTLAVHIADLPECTPIEVWFQDEARLGQKKRQTRIRTKKGTRPRLPATNDTNQFICSGRSARRGVLVSPRNGSFRRINTNWSLWTV